MSLKTVYGFLTRIFFFSAMAVAKSLRTELHLAGAQILVERSEEGLWQPTLLHWEEVSVLQPTAGTATATEKAVAKAALEALLHWKSRWENEHLAETEEMERTQIETIRQTLRVAIMSPTVWHGLHSPGSGCFEIRLNQFYSDS